MASFDPKEFEEFKASNSLDESSGFDPKEFESFKTARPDEVTHSLMDKLQAVAEQATNTAKKAVAAIPTPVVKGAETLMNATSALGGDPSGLLNQVVQNRDTLVQNAPAAGGLAGGIVGNVPGALLGGAAGEALRQVNNAVGGNVEPSSLEAAKSIGKRGAEQAVAQAAGQYVLGPAVNMAAKGVSKAGGALTKMMSKASGVPEESINYVAKNPGAVLPEALGGAPGKETANAAFKEGLKEAGIPQTRTVDEIKYASKEAVKTMRAIEEAGAKGEMPELSPKQLLRTRQWLDDAIGAAKRSGEYETMTAWLQQKQMIQTLLDNSAKPLQAASKVYSQYKRVAPFANLLPIDKAGNPSLAKAVVAEFFMNGGGPRAAWKALYASPMIQGAATAGVGRVAKTVKTVARPGREILKAFMAKYAQDRLR